jgi:hypothetical protein
VSREEPESARSSCSGRQLRLKLESGKPVNQRMPGEIGQPAAFLRLRHRRNRRNDRLLSSLCLFVLVVS